MATSTHAYLAMRYRAVRDRLATAGLDALLVTSLPNIFYLTGFAGSAGVVMVTPGAVTLLTDFRYVAEVRQRLEDPSGVAGWPGAALVQVEGSYDETLVGWLGRQGAGRVGFEAAHVPVSRHAWWIARLGSLTPPPTELVSTEGLVEQVRIRKDPAEIATLRHAAGLLSRVARDILLTVEPGPTERELAALVDFKLKAAGFARPAFDTIVAAGPNAALPHARPTDRRLQPGDLLLLDFGGVYDGYCVDLTRTVCLGEADGQMRRIHEAVAQAQHAAIAAVRPGVPPAAVDGAARRVLGEHGLGEAFGHGTGHGLGVEVHEAPRVAPARSDTPLGEILEPGMVFTIEPGAYLPGWGGVRIEDDVLVTADGCEVLTDVPRGLGPQALR